MAEYVNEIVEYLIETSNTCGIFLSVLFGFSLVIIESIIPILPLALFIAINMVILGNVLGFIVSWIGTIMGCSLSFLIFRKGFSKFLYKKVHDDGKAYKLMNAISNISFSKLVLILAIPFTPAFSINIGAGLSKISYKKYLLALLISKLSIIYFWGFIGTTLIESITDITVVVKVLIILIITFILSKIAIKGFNIE